VLECTKHWSHHRDRKESEGELYDNREEEEEEEEEGKDEGSTEQREGGDCHVRKRRREEELYVRSDEPSDEEVDMDYLWNSGAQTEVAADQLMAPHDY